MGCLGAYPCPGAGPGVALDEDVLRCGACCADTVDGGLVKAEDERVVHVVILIVGVEDDLVVGCEQLGCGCPPRFKTFNIGDDLVVVPACKR